MSTDTPPDDGPDIPEKDWSNPFHEEYPLHDLYGRRVRNNQDLVIIIDDYHARRGTGKTVAALQLAAGMNQAGELTTANATTRAEELRNAYAKLPERSALVLDEGELGANKYEASTKTNKALREIMSIGRVLEKYVVVTMPEKGMLDPEVWKMSDVWISMVEKGRGIVHYLKQNPYASGDSTQTEKVGTISFKDIQTGTQLREVYNDLTAQKRDHISGGEATDYVPRQEVKEQVAEERKEARKDMRDTLIRSIYDRLGDLDDEDLQRIQRSSGVSQALIGEAVGLSQPQVGNIVRNDES
jgi:hypothetical protein